MLVSSCSKSHLGFWDLSDYTLVKVINKCYCSEAVIYSLIELANGNVALYFEGPPPSIMIINPNQFTIVKQIVNSYINEPSCLCLYKDSSFIYAHNGKLIQISTIDYKVLFVGTFEGNQNQGQKGVVSTFDHENIIISDPGYKGILIL